MIFQLILSFSLQKEGGSGRALLGNPDSVAVDDHPRPSLVREEPLVILQRQEMTSLFSVLYRL